MKNFIVFILFLALTLPVFSISDEADITYNVGWTEKLGEKIDFNAEITSSNNLTKKFKDFVDPNKPTVLILAYYSCPKMCTFLLDGVLEVVNLINNIRPGLDYNLVALSFDKKDTFETSGFKEERYNKDLTSNEQWAFFSADSTNISSVTNSVGFKLRRWG